MADLNAFHVACIIGSFHVILDMFISTLNAMKYFINKKKHLLGIALEIVCHVIRYTVVHGLLFERHSLPSCPTQARVPLLGPPLISSKLRWTVIGSQTSVLFRLRAFSRAMEAPQKLGELIPPRDTLNQRGQG